MPSCIQGANTEPPLPRTCNQSSVMMPLAGVFRIALSGVMESACCIWMAKGQGFKPDMTNFLVVDLSVLMQLHCRSYCRGPEYHALDENEVFQVKWFARVRSTMPSLIFPSDTPSFSSSKADFTWAVSSFCLIPAAQTMPQCIWMAIM